MTDKQAEITLKLDSLTGLRFVAALAVFAWHIRTRMTTPAPEWFDPLLVAGQSGVSFFFVLSGFVLTWSHREEDTARRFYWRRIARVYPNHFVTWLLMIPVAVKLGQIVDAKTLAATLSLTQAWIPDGHVYFGINGVSWSLACEAFFYAVFPFLIRPCLNATPAQRRALLVGTVALIAVLELGVLAAVGGAGVQNEKTLPIWSIYILPPTRLLEFVCGMIVAAEVRSGASWDIGLGRAISLAAVAYYLSGLFPRSTVAVWLTIIPSLLLIAAAAASDRRGRRSIFGHRWLIVLGEWSFAFYLVHQAIIRVASRPLALLVGHTAAILVELCLSIGAAAALHAMIERPCERLIRRRFAGSPMRISDPEVETARGPYSRP